MVKDAQGHAAEDQARRDLIDARNQADTLAYQAEKTVSENRDEAARGGLSAVEAAIAAARKAVAGDDLSAIKKATDDLRAARRTMWRSCSTSRRRTRQRSATFSGSTEFGCEGRRGGRRGIRRDVK